MERATPFRPARRAAFSPQGPLAFLRPAFSAEPARPAAPLSPFSPFRENAGSLFFETRSPPFGRAGGAPTLEEETLVAWFGGELAPPRPPYPSPGGLWRAARPPEPGRHGRETRAAEDLSQALAFAERAAEVLLAGWHHFAEGPVSPPGRAPSPAHAAGRALAGQAAVERAAAEMLARALARATPDPPEREWSPFGPGAAPVDPGATAFGAYVDVVPSLLFAIPLVAAEGPERDSDPEEPPARPRPPRPRAETHKVRGGDDLCVVCCDSPPQTRFLPCSHAPCCWNCAGRLRRCPLCRAPVDSETSWAPTQGDAENRPRLNA